MNNINPILHTIKPGDTLYNLAMQYGTTIQNIMNTNPGLNPYNLRVGQQIYIYPNYENNQNYWVSMNEVNLLEKINLVWEQHIMWTGMLLISIAENLKDLNQTQERLLKNPKDIADIFRIYYGNNVANTIEKLLTEHLTIGKDLIVALKNNNQSMANELNRKWYQNADEMADAFSSINPFWRKEEIQKMLYEHLRLTTIQVDNRLKCNYGEDIKAYDMVQKEILKMSNFFTSGILNQFPTLFS